MFLFLEERNSFKNETSFCICYHYLIFHAFFVVIIKKSCNKIKMFSRTISWLKMPEKDQLGTPRSLQFLGVEC